MILAHIRSSFLEALLPRKGEVVAAGLTIALGWLLFAHPDLMADTTRRGYMQLLAIADQMTWAVVLLAFGALRMAVLIINGAWRRSPHARGIMAFLSCFFWTQITLSFAPTFGFAFISFAGWLVLDFCNMAQSFSDAQKVDTAHAARKRDGHGDRAA